jgi:hypothetical protein
MEDTEGAGVPGRNTWEGLGQPTPADPREADKAEVTEALSDLAEECRQTCMAEGDWLCDVLLDIGVAVDAGASESDVLATLQAQGLQMTTECFKTILVLLRRER